MEMSAGPSKTDIEAVFNRLRTQGSNKVYFAQSFREKQDNICVFIFSFDLNKFISYFSSITFIERMESVDMFRLQCEESNMVIGDIRCFYLY